MKNIIVILAVLFFGMGVFAQTAKVNGNENTFKEQLASNHITYILPENTTSEMVEKSAQYYIDYFNVEFDEKSKKATLKLINNDEASRRVINRFLLSTGVRTINFDGNDYKIMEFYSKYLE